VWDAHTGRNISPADSPLGKGEALYATDRAALAADFSPDGTKLVVGFASKDALLPGEVSVWDIATGKPDLPRLKTAVGVVQVAFSPDGKFVHIVGADSTRWAWDRKENEIQDYVIDSTKPEQPASGPWLSPNGIHTAVARHTSVGRHSHVIVWNLVTNRAVTPLLRHEAPVKSAAFDREGCRLATAGPGLPVRVFDFGGGLPTFPGREFTAWPDNGQSWSGFSPDGKRAVLRALPGATQLWDLEAEKPLGRAHFLESASCSWDCTAERPLLIRPRYLDHQTEFRLGNAATGKKTRIRVDNAPTENKPWAIATPDGRWLITSRARSGTQIWDAETGNAVTTLATSARVFECSPDSRTLVGFDPDGKVHAWALPSGRVLWTAAVIAKDPPLLEFSRDGRLVLVISQAVGRIEIWDAQTGTHRCAPIRVPGPIRQYRLTRDGQRLFTLDADKGGRLWNTHTGEPLGPEWKTDRSSSVTFSDDGTKVWLADSELTQGRLWDPIRGKPAGPPILAWNIGWLSPDGRLVYATSHPLLDESRSVPVRIALRSELRTRLIETETGLPLTPPLTDVPDYYFRFSADGRRLVFLMDGVVHRRDLITEERSGEELENLAVALSRHRIDESESFVPVDRARWQQAWQAYKSSRLPRDRAYTARERHEWHVQAAVDCLKAYDAWGGARFHLDLALRHKPSSGLLHYLRARALEHLGDEAKALADLDQAVALEPGCRNAWESRAWLHLRRENLAQATADFAKVIEIGTDQFDVWHHLALLYLSTGKAPAYRALCQRMLAALAPEGDLNPEEMLLTCVLQAGAVDPARLLAIVAGLKKFEVGPIPKSPALAYYRAGKYAEAVTHLERYLRYRETVSEALSGADHVWAALIYHKAGRKAEAETWRRRAATWRQEQGKTAAWAERAEFDLLFQELQALGVSEK
jgi:WD40 repeat protein/tetratricopeptide (TPR) repeat protein